METLFRQVGEQLRTAGVFGEVAAGAQELQCAARTDESEAHYRVDTESDPTSDGPGLWIGLYTPDRWLSESIEADLMFKGDKIEDLLEEELIDQGLDERLDVEHFRDEQKRFVFRSRLDPGPGPIDDRETIGRVVRAVLAYEACFRELGDLRPSEE